LPSEPEDLVVNTGPIIALGKIEAFDLITGIYYHPELLSTFLAAMGE
jgi:hypothetical protein